ncbi:histidine utilization repressor [Cardiobacteriaceae bacterium TAE3-ERU3]|nr:histidine utilization repressor [Cardiobacteriaceae bacterium TAE3-ERU3]
MALSPWAQKSAIVTDCPVHATLDMKKNTHRTPVYQQIKAHILMHIHNGHWKSGEQIPTELKLAADFDVSRMTVNRAIQELVSERVLERIQGSGTFVARQKFNTTLIEIHNLAEEIIQRGHAYRAEVVTQRMIEADDELAQIFDVAKGAALAEVFIVHYDNGEALQLEQRWVNPAIAPTFIEQDFTAVNTSAWLIEHVPLESGRYTVEALTAPPDIAHLLNIGVDNPALVLRRATCSQGKVVTHVVMWHPGAAYQFSGTL